jgi:DNA sulfur modification protein DndC
VDKDRSLDALIAGDHQHLEPLADFRRRLKTVSEDPDCRSKTRRNGLPGLGPLTMETRRMLLDELLAIQNSVGTELISGLEVRLIREQWIQDDSTAVMRGLAQSSTSDQELTEILPAL